MSFKHESGDWTRFREMKPCIEIDFHLSESGPRATNYEAAMGDVRCRAMSALKNAYEIGLRFVIFTHGHSTSRPGHTTARSEVRGLMRSSDATPYIKRGECIQHESVFVAALKTNATAKLPRISCSGCGSDDLQQMATGGRFRCRECKVTVDWFDMAGVSWDSQGL